MLDRVLARDFLRGLEGYFDATRLEVVGLAVVLDERRSVIEVTGITELDRRRALAGVVALVGDREARLEVSALGLLPQLTKQTTIIVVVPSKGRNGHCQR